MVFESRDRLLAIIETQTKVAEGLLDLDAVMDLVTAKARELTESAGAAIQRLERREAVIVSASGSMERYLGARSDGERSLATEAFEGQKIIRHGDPAKDGIPERERFDAASWIAVPIIEDGKVAAALVVTSPTPHHFEDEDVETARLLGRLLEAAFSQVARRAGSSDMKDPVTGLGNRAAFDEQLEAEVARANRYGTPLSLAVLQLSGLQQSDSSGEAAMLRKVAGLLAKTRAPDRFFRIDDESLAVILPNTPRKGGMVAAARFKLMLETEKLAGGKLSMNYGVAELTNDDADGLLAAAEASLYAGSINRRDLG